MDAYWRYLGAALLCAVIALTVREGHRAMGTAFALAAGAALLMPLLAYLREAVETLKAIASYADLGGERMALIVKMLGIAFAGEFAAQACRDAGEGGIAMRVELCGKVLLLLLAAPLLREMAELILEMTA